MPGPARSKGCYRCREKKTKVGHVLVVFLGREIVTDNNSSVMKHDLNAIAASILVYNAQDTGPKTN